MPRRVMSEDVRRIAITLRTVARKRSVGVANVGRVADAGGAWCWGEVGGETRERWECFWARACAGVTWPGATSGSRSAVGPSYVGEAA